MTVTKHEDSSTAPHSADASESFWEPHYQKNIRPWTGLPNAVLADITADLTPGSVLDIGCGEGGDALWLAGRGWMVTAIDVSATVLERARTQAAERGLTANVTFEKYDASQSFPDGLFDLVSAQYFHTPIGIAREQVLRRAAATVALQGLLLIVDHASTAPGPGTKTPTLGSRHHKTPWRSSTSTTITGSRYASKQHGEPHQDLTGRRPP